MDTHGVLGADLCKIALCVTASSHFMLLFETKHQLLGNNMFWGHSLGWFALTATWIAWAPLRFSCRLCHPFPAAAGSQMCELGTMLVPFGGIFLPDIIELADISTLPVQYQGCGE